LLDKALDGTHNHFLCYLPNRIGWFSSWILKLFYSGIKIDPSESAILDNIPKDAVVVYVTKLKSQFEYLFCHTRYQQAGMPSPEIAFDYRLVVWQPISRLLKVLLAHTHSLFHNHSLPDPYKGGYIRQELCSERSGFLSLVEKKGFYKWFVKSKTDPVRHLIEIQRSMDRPIYLVPQLFFFGKNPIPAIPSIIDALFGPEQRPGILRRIATLFKTPEKIFMEISEPVNLKRFVEKAENRRQTIEHQSLLLRRNLLLQINQHRQSITGPILKLREELKENILTNDRLQTYMDQFAQKRNMPIKKVHKEAAGYIDEIAASYSMAFIRFAEFCVRQITKYMYDGVSVNHDGLNRIKSISKKGPIIFIPCHKSHIDYLILSYIMYHNNMPCPHVAAGKNLSFWPMGTLFRGCGAFFIRRTFKGAVLYAKVFAEYIYKLLEEGFNIEFFIEGGRSRTGKLLTPKLGLLSILLNAYKEGACSDMIIAPVFIGYDRVLEESAYLNELEGGQKEPENFRQVIKARKFLKKRYGKIYIRFHEPISLNELLQNGEKPIYEMTQKEVNTFCRSLGTRALNAIDKVSVVTPHALVASAILNSSKKRFSYQHVIDQIEAYMSYLFLQDAKLTDTLVHDPIHAVDLVLESYVHRKFIEIHSGDMEDESNDVEFTVNEGKRPILEYYKNNCVSFFIPAAFTALSILSRDAFQFISTALQPDFRVLQEFFKNEFAADVDRPPEYFIRKSIKAFIEDAILMPHPTLPDTYNLTSEGFRKLKFYSRFVKSYFESYWIVLHYLKRKPQNSIDPKERLKKIQSLGNRMYKNNEIEMKEALSKVNYKNAVDFFIEHGLRGSENTDKIEFYSQTIQSYLSYLET
jgi:glycerol-3-phosphate O-acyltransferase